MKNCHIIFIIFYWIFIVNGNDLSSFGIKSYEIIRAIHDEKHDREKRSIYNENSSRVLILQLDHKNLTLILKNTNQYFTNNADIHFGSSIFHSINSSILYQGYVFNYPNNSLVFGGFYSNCFDGIIHLLNETWHIEPTRKYGKILINIGPSIIYNVLDVDIMKYQMNSTFRFKENFINSDLSSSELNDQLKRKKIQEEIEQLSKSIRSKREIFNRTERTCCSLYIRIDPTLWDLVYRNEGLYDKEATIHALVTFVYRIITATNEIYREIQFKSYDDYFYRFTLRLRRIRILTFDDCQEKNLSLSEINLCRPYLDSNVLLTWHSAENFAEYCLAYLFSARDFGDGTLGLAWMGTITSNSRGGICEKPARDIYEGKRVIKTLNSGIITVINHHTRVSTLMSELTFAHEIGHSLGAEHDNEICGGDATFGHYIMSRKATTGLEKNNNRFSNCSMETMGPVVLAVKNELFGKVNCLTECSQIEYCGNRHIEDGEECDCGFRSECTENCCYPAGDSDPKLACKLKPDAHCSPSAGPCCSEQCRYHPATHICHRDRSTEDCIGDVPCDGIRASCPVNDSRFFKVIDTPCNLNTALCDRGECNKSICTLINKTECSLMIPNVVELLRQRSINREYLCHIGCFDLRTNSCIDTHDLMMPNNFSTTGFGYKYRPGHACAGTAGYCDVFGKCRAVDAEGPLIRLKNIFLNEANIHTLTEIVKYHWWALVLGLLGLIGLMSIFVKICSVHTPSSNPRLKPARSFSFKHQSHYSPPIDIELDPLEEHSPENSRRGKSSSDHRKNTSHL